MELKEFTIIDASFQRFCTEADKFIAGCRKYYIEELKKNGKDFEKLRKEAINRNIA